MKLTLNMNRNDRDAVEIVTINGRKIDVWAVVHIDFFDQELAAELREHGEVEVKMEVI